MGRIKGTSFLHLVRMLRSQRARAMEVLPVALHHYLQERILAGSWYPDEDVLGVMRAFFQVVGGGEQAWERAGEVLARNDLNGVYSNVVRPGASVEQVVKHVSVLWSNYHDTGSEKASFAAGKCTIEIKDASMRSADYCRLIGGYNAAVIQVAGGRVLRMKKVSCTAEGNPTCIWEYDWLPHVSQAVPTVDDD
jgi:hypothetical protein